MEKNRLFTFGCSFTQYKWPSWADILGLNFDEFYNFGQPGSGNFFLLYQFIFANEYYKFNKNDTLIFMLSNDARVDIIKNKEWLTTGLVFHSKEILGNKFFEHYTETHAVESSYMYVYLLKEMLKKIDCKYEILNAFSSFYGNESDFLYGNLKTISDIKYNLTNTEIESVEKFMKSINDESYDLINDLSKKTYKDGHPTVSAYLKYVKKYLSKYYNENYDSIVKEWESMISNNQNDNVIEYKFKNIVLKNKVMFINGNINNNFLYP